MPCDYPILQSSTQEQVSLVLGDTVQQSQIETAFSKAPQKDRASASKFRCIMSAVGTTLLQSPGFHIGLCPHYTLGIYTNEK